MEKRQPGRKIRTFLEVNNFVCIQLKNPVTHYCSDVNLSVKSSVLHSFKRKILKEILYPECFSLKFLLETASYSSGRRMAERPRIIRSGSASVEQRHKEGCD